MTRRVTIGALLLAFAGFTAAGVRAGRQAGKSNAAGDERERLIATGKKIFVEKCASCHDERGGKPLKTGLPLNERALSTDAIARAVNGRLRDRTEDERRGVTLYIASLMKSKDATRP
jgi:mono/diheme cytochrome c family protein